MDSAIERERLIQEILDLSDTERSDDDPTFLELMTLEELREFRQDLNDMLQ